MVPGYQDFVSVNLSSAENFNMYFKASRALSGLFRCIKSIDGGFGYTAHVIVLDAQPTCSYKLPLGFLTAKCSIEFGGYWSPKLEWSNANKQLEANETTTTPNKRVESSITVPYKNFNPQAPYVLTCTPKFSLDDITLDDSTARNIPEFPHSCTVSVKLPGFSLIDTSTPMNQASVRDTPVQLNCSNVTKGESSWKLQNQMDSDEIIIYSLGRMAQRFQDYVSVNVSSAENVNVYFNASNDLSGIFRCVKSSAGGSGYTAHVIVLDAQPTCSYTISDGFLTATCDINYSGLWRPKLEWINANKTIIGNTEYFSTFVNQEGSSITVPYENDNPQAPYVLTCTPKFSPDDITLDDKTATNIPEFPHSCTVSVKQPELSTPGPELSTPGPDFYNERHGFNDYGSTEAPLPPGHSYGDMFILNLLKAYAYSGCKGILVGSTMRQIPSPGHEYIIKLLLPYLITDCKGAVKRKHGAALDEPYSAGEKAIIELLSFYFSSGCKVVDIAVRTAVRNVTAGERHIIDRLSCYFSDGCRARTTEAPLLSGYSAGEMSILNLLNSYAQSGCKAGKGKAAKLNEQHSLGQDYIFKLLSAYTATDCKAASDAVEPNHGAASDVPYSAGEKAIIELLSSYISSDCKDGETVVDIAVRTEPGLNFTAGERHIINRLSCYFSDGCRGDTGEREKSKDGAAVRHVPSVALELFLLIGGVFLTRIYI